MAQAHEIAAPQSPSNSDDVHYTVFIRLPFPRGDFVDPPEVCYIAIMIYNRYVDLLQVNWNSAKDRELWDLLSRASSKAKDLDCENCAHFFIPKLY